MEMKGEVRARRVTLRCQFCMTLNRVDLAKARIGPQCGECQRPFLVDRPVKATDQDLDRLVSDAELPVLVDFYADWCGPCKIMAPRLDELARERTGEILVAKVDTDANPASATKFGIQGIPTLILFRDGQESGRRTGVITALELEALVENG